MWHQRIATEIQILSSDAYWENYEQESCYTGWSFGITQRVAPFILLVVRMSKMMAAQVIDLKLQSD
jgi:hypothetical protein